MNRFSFKKLLTSILLLTSTIPGIKADNTMSDGIVYQDKHVRFTVVTDGLMRMEYSPDGKFINDKSLVAVCRNYPAAAAEVKEDGQNIIVSTSKMTLRYKKNSGAFKSDNLFIESSGNIKPFKWCPGTEQKNNLLGTTRTLDQWD